MGLIEKLYEAATGRPYYTEVRMSAEFGPPPAVEYADIAAHMTDDELARYTPAEFTVYARAVRATRTRTLVTAGGER